MAEMAFETGSRRWFRLLLLIGGSLMAGGSLSSFEQGGMHFVSSAGPEGIKWRVAEIGGKPSSLRDGEDQPNLLLDPNQKRASGFSGCNSFFATYTLDGSSLTFGPVASTRRACPEPAGTSEVEFLTVLEKTRGWKMDDGSLYLLAEKETLARFTRMGMAEVAPDWDSMFVRSAVIPSAGVQLSRGEYRRPAAPGSASEVSVRMTDKRAFGLVAGGELAAAVVLSSTGGSGTFAELALFAKDAGQWVNSDTILLGDRVKVDSVRFESGSVLVTMTTHGPADPACCPTVKTKKRFAVMDDSFVAQEAATMPGEPHITTTEWQWVQTLSGDGTKTVPDRPQDYTVEFLANGELGVRADCNRKGGNYSLQNGKLAITITHSTMAACKEGSLEDRFVRNLGAAAGAFLRDGDLYIDLKYDSGTMKFSKRP